MDSKAKCHVRSISLPSRTHPLTSSVEDQLNRLNTSQATSSSSFSSSVCQKLGGLGDLYENVDDLLQLPLTQQALSHEQHKEKVEEILDGSLRLVDVCGTTRDLFSQIKECVQELESSLRRKRGDESNMADQVSAYMISKKKLSKSIGKLSQNLKRMKKKSASNEEFNQVVAISTLTQVEDMSLEVFESLLSMISSSKGGSKSNGWSLVSKYLKSKQVSSDINQLENLDVELLQLVNKKPNKEINLQCLLKQVEALELKIQQVEQDLQCIYRRLVKTRVSLLNIVNH
ncbi:hypothetical protein JRO89_XS07G0009700 [Xanthoceras sorbifolium]|uniref:Uncharacterized protein n=1 Tax=Xanthoceras sorbifolium TaxID=99658 RepID=A0ABQ8HRR2_9ROSI|nr:hypothetical protein JRO89_XS07G0009700 [Xanthoceras sorbifolium]